jgi:hypothetical protein
LAKFGTAPLLANLGSLGVADGPSGWWQRACFAAIAGVSGVLAAGLIRDGLQAQPGSPSRGRAATLVDADLAGGPDELRALAPPERAAPTVTE